jgi:hypothetical protein
MSFKHAYLISIFILLPLLGYGAMRLIVYLFGGTDGTNIFFLIMMGLAVVLIGLTVPYLMLKTTFLDAHVWNREEKEIKLSDIPKDQDDIGAETGNENTSNF